MSNTEVSNTAVHASEPEAAARLERAETGALHLAKPERSLPKLIGIVLGVPVLLILMLLSFLIPSLNSGAHDLPLAVAGPEAAISQITDKLDAASPDAFEVTTYDSAEAAREAVHDREAIGALTVGQDGVHIVVASGAGTPYAPMLKTIGATLQQAGQTVTVEDVAPLTEADPNGSALATLGLPLVFGGNVTAILLINLLKRQPWLRLIGALCASLVGGFATAAVMQFWLEVVQGDYLLTASALSLGIAAISLLLLGLHHLWGMAGIGIAAVLLLFVANPLAGLATGPAWLPAPWGTIGQLLPVGAAGTAVRSAAFFGDGGGGTAFLTLGIWALCGVLLSVIVTHHRSKHAAA